MKRSILSLFYTARNSGRQSVTSIAVAALFMLTFHANIVKADITSQQASVLEVIGEYAIPDRDILTPVFQKLGYHPQTTFWNTFPAIRKLEELYRAAEAASPG